MHFQMKRTSKLPSIIRLSVAGSPVCGRYDGSARCQVVASMVARG